MVMTIASLVLEKATQNLMMIEMSQNLNLNLNLMMIYWLVMGNNVTLIMLSVALLKVIIAGQPQRWPVIQLSP